MNIIKWLLVKLGVKELKPHEKAELGKGVWGRQPEPTNPMPTKARPKATIKMRIWREATQSWEEK